MNKFTKYACAAMMLLLPASAMAEERDEEIEALKKRVEILESEGAKQSANSLYAPQLFGSMMAYFNLNTYDGDQRFALRNAHLGVKGNASNNVSYYIQINFHNLAKVTVLDSYIRYSYGGFDLTLGQQWIHLTSDFDRCGPKSSLFTSRSYGVVYLPVYTSGSSTGSFGNRDIGLYANYTFASETAITLSAGIFNGSGMNTIVWDDDINFTGRVQIGASKGLSGGASIYCGNTSFDQWATIYSGEIRYKQGDIFVEANYQRKSVEMESGDQITTTALVEGYYSIKTPNSSLFDSYAPTVRYDFGDGMLYSNLLSGEIEEQRAGRISALVSFMLKGSKVRSRLSVGYDKVFMSEKPSDIAENTLFQDRFTVAMTVAF